MTDGIKTQNIAIMVRECGSSENITKKVVYKYDMSSFVDTLRMVFDSNKDLYIVVEPVKIHQTFF